MSKPIKYITIEDVTKLYRSTKDKELKLAMLLGFGSGLRISEIVGFQRKYKYKDKVRFEDKSSIPPLTAEMIDLKAHQIRLGDAKGGKWRVTVTSPNLTQEMLKLLPLKVPRRTLQHKFTALCKEVLGKSLSFHVLRHGFGNHQANVCKLPLPIVQQMMGHSDVGTTGIYTKVNPEFAIGQAWKAMVGESQ